MTRFLLLALCATTGWSGTLVHYPGGVLDAIGGIVTVTYGDNTTAQGVIAAPDSFSRSIYLPGEFELYIPVDSSTGGWILDDLRPQNPLIGGQDIRTFVVDLTGTNALFDTDTQPNTPGSGPGHVGGQFFPGGVWNGHYPQQSLSSLWSDPVNNGDLFLISTKIFEAGLLGPAGSPNNSAGWSQDLDSWSNASVSDVPEPGTLILAGLGLLVVSRATRRFSRRNPGSK